ncbi:MAG TPA: sigma-70 family RNA polymerase sigma factor, partial [Urbifossiella sp.]|nr:sigma-70 family RNA polymerase sigma factor [Urbifossiella sp.]
MGIALSVARVLAGGGPESDAALLARYAGTREPAAFAALFDRHGPMVRSVCRRYCRDPHTAADAEQGVWLVLARKAAGVSRPERLAAWLFGVALRVCRRAAGSGRGGRPADARAVPDVAVAVLADELLRVLDEELAALPEAERLPLVLCYLEGRTQDEAARVCGTCVRTLRRRLDRGRAALRRRLERRGVAPAAALAGLAVAPAAGARPAVLEVALRGGPIPSSLSPWVAEELAMAGTTWWVRAALVVGLGVGTAVAAAGMWGAGEPPAAPPAPAAPAAGPGDLPKGVLARLGSSAFRHPGEVGSVAFAAGGRQLAAVGQGAYSRWAVADGLTTVSARSDAKGYRHLTVTSPDGKLAVELLNPGANAGEAIYAALATDLTIGKTVGVFAATRGDPQSGPYSLSGAISPDGSTLAVQYCQEISLYSLPTGNLIQRLTDDGRTFRHTTFTPDGKRLVAGTLDKLVLTVWDAASGRKVKTLDAGGTGTACLALSPDGKMAVTVGGWTERKRIDNGELTTEHWDTELVAWDLVAGKVVHRVTDDAPVRLVHLPGDGTAVCVVDPNETFARSAVRRWRLADGKRLWGEPADHGVRSSALSPDGTLLATASPTGIVRLWDVATGKVRPRTDGHTRSIYSLAFSADGKTIRTADDTELRVWDAATGRPTGRFAHPELAGFTRWDAAGRVVVAGANTIDDNRRTVAVFDAVTEKKLLAVTDPDRAKGFGWCGFDLSADGTKLVLPVTTDRKLHFQLWDVPAAKMVWDVETPADWQPGQLKITADGRVLAGGTDLLALDAATGKQLARWDFRKSEVLPPDPSNNTHLYPSGDGRVLGFVIQGVGIFLVDSRTGRL